jgi:hypothetical protein
MKPGYLIYLLALTLVLSCEKDSDAPRVELLNSDWMNTSTSIVSGGILKYKWKVTRGNADLATFTLRQDGIDLAPRFPQTGIPADVYLDSAYLEGPIQEGTYVYQFLATDRDGKTGERALVVTVE